MSRPPKREEIYLEIGFRSSDPDGRLKTIELLGVPGEKLRSGQCVVSEKMQKFFDNLIVRKLFRESRRLPDCNFEYLKIWLYDTEARNNPRGYSVPDIDDRDVEIPSNISYSKLKTIYVLSNELSDRELVLWRNNAENLFFPLFREFIAPPEPPSILTDTSTANNPIVKMFEPGLKLVEQATTAVDPYAKMKQNLFFDALIIQID